MASWSAVAARQLKAAVEEAGCKLSVGKTKVVASNAEIASIAGPLFERPALGFEIAASVRDLGGDAAGGSSRKKLGVIKDS